MTANGTKLYVRAGGSGPAVVLLHGYGETGDMWVPLANDLARDHTVVVPDLRGMGLSAKPASGYDKKTQGHDVARILDAPSSERNLKEAAVIETSRIAKVHSVSASLCIAPASAGDFCADMVRTNGQRAGQRSLHEDAIFSPQGKATRPQAGLGRQAGLSKCLVAADRWEVQTAGPTEPAPCR
jgi:hypothetical protein